MGGGKKESVSVDWDVEKDWILVMVSESITS